ncbi:hypothetical protein OGAPHI_000231 [Ogataea philodendri]|uniref:Uncharacterized protein n=1 Tax=Ogataea philodendri TaxID=1378263 RepID=A0A9P8PFY3_9ASCO|nr:uncharacterized protein OGAPHI_000231 [Ogataea philodendri]KAH3671528.1 hypothetical protein OGAPHI_000231 [Ogataea philodendri]
MDGSHSESEVLVSLAWHVETGLSDHVGKRFLVRESLDTLDEVLRLVVNLGEFQACKDSSRLENTVGGVKTGLDVGEVSDTKSDGVNVLGVVLDSVELFTVLF